MFGAITADHQPINAPFGCNPRDLVMERRWSNMKSSHTEVAPNCPRCASSNTKFCYYNNYSLSQPRYFCKGCRRYWTKGGSLRNVPVGGGCRKSRKSKSARLAADQRNGLSYQMPSPGSTSTNTDDSNGPSAANIDLAAVFANYLNPDSSINNDIAVEVGEDDLEVNVNGSINVDQESSSSTGVSYSSLEFPPTNCFDAENHHHLRNVMMPYDHLHPMFPPLLDQDCDDALNLQAILGDEEMLPNFDQWQSIMQFQDFGSSYSFSSDQGDLKNINMESWSTTASYNDLSSADYNQIIPRHEDDHHHWNSYNN